MIDKANDWMKEGNLIACERISSVNDNMTESHYHEFYEIYYLESGERYHLLDEELYLVTPGQFIIFEPYTMHHSYGQDNMPFSRLLAYFKEDSISSEEVRHALKGISGVYQLEHSENSEFYHGLCEMLKEQEEKQEFYKIDMQAKLNHLLIHLLRSKTERKTVCKNSRITSIISYMNQNYQKRITTDELAKEFFLSKWHLCREFKYYTHLTIIQYINSLRIMQAQKLLLEGSKNITEISAEVGFESMTHFERVFKQIVGITATQYKRRKNRK